MSGNREEMQLIWAMIAANGGKFVLDEDLLVTTPFEPEIFVGLDPITRQMTYEIEMPKPIIDTEGRANEGSNLYSNALDATCAEAEADPRALPATVQRDAHVQVSVPSED